MALFPPDRLYPMTPTKALLTLDDKTPPIEIPVLSGSLGNPVLDIGSLGEHGYFTFDPGFVSTASCQSSITYIDGDKSLLYYRGYPIEDLAQHCDFLEVAYLLNYKELPTPAQKERFTHAIKDHAMLHDLMSNFYRGFRRDAHPMAVMLGVVGGMSAFYHSTSNPFDPALRELTITRLIAKMPTVAAWCYKYSIGQPFIYPQDHLSYAENFLHMMFATPRAPYQVDPVVVRALDLILILHADHEQNASTSTVRIAGSSGANSYACIAAGIASLWGPLHGGANEATLKMLETIGSVEHINQYIQRAKDHSDPFRLMGFGHRVYKNTDPRAKILRKSCHDVLHTLGLAENPLFKLALALEKIALEDDYFIQKKLYPNIDFYSGIIMRAIGIPDQMFTAIFALARTAGWAAQWNEMISNPNHKICRPRQMYNGHARRDFVPIADRQMDKSD